MFLFPVDVQRNSPWFIRRLCGLFFFDQTENKYYILIRKTRVFLIFGVKTDYKKAFCVTELNKARFISFLFVVHKKFLELLQNNWSSWIQQPNNIKCYYVIYTLKAEILTAVTKLKLWGCKKSSLQCFWRLWFRWIFGWTAPLTAYFHEHIFSVDL